MRSLVKWPGTVRSGVVIAIAVVAVMAAANFAFALNDEFGGASFSTPYAPYTAGPVVREDDTRPYAPYTAGPVVREDDTRPYAPYTAGPVVAEDERVPERIGNYLLR